MAEGYLKKFLKGKAEVYSAGIEAHGLNPRAVQVMREDGVDISSQQSRSIDQLPEKDFDVVITVCDHAQEQCPVFPSRAKMIHHSFADPAKAKGSEEEIMEVFRKVRDEIREYTRGFKL